MKPINKSYENYLKISLNTNPSILILNNWYVKSSNRPDFGGKYTGRHYTFEEFVDKINTDLKFTNQFL